MLSGAAYKIEFLL